FLSGHLGGMLTLADLGTLRAADFRAFMAARRSEGIGSRSLARGLSGLKSFFAFCERQGLVYADALARGPKKPASLPKAMTVSEARATLLATGTLEERPWVAARDTAVIALLYGAGLRIAEDRKS